MELANINEILVKYENAETTLQEEQMLKKYFQQDTVPAHLIEYKELFNYFDDSSKEHFTKPIPIKPRSANWKWLSIAASVVLLISLYTIKSSDSIMSASERQEAQLAYQETQKAFQLISQNLNKGNTVAMNGLQEFEKAQNKIFTKNK